MEKFKVILVVLNKNFLRNALAILNYNRTIPVAVLTDDGAEKFVALNDKVRIQVLPIASLNQVLEIGKNFLWLICGRNSDKDAPDKLKKFLAANEVPEENIINFELTEQINPVWLANLRHVEENSADCFATGDSFTDRLGDFLSGLAAYLPFRDE